MVEGVAPTSTRTTDIGAAEIKVYNDVISGVKNLVVEPCRRAAVQRSPRGLAARWMAGSVLTPTQPPP